MPTFLSSFFVFLFNFIKLKGELGRFITFQTKSSKLCVTIIRFNAIKLFVELVLGFKSDVVVSTFAFRFVSYSLPLCFLFCWQFTVLF